MESDREIRGKRKRLKVIHNLPSTPISEQWTLSSSGRLFDSSVGERLSERGNVLEERLINRFLYNDKENPKYLYFFLSTERIFAGFTDQLIIINKMGKFRFVMIAQK